MHDIVRDVCLWITSKGENIFMSKIDMDLTQLTREKGWKQYTAISLLENKLKELSVRLVCPKLKILLLGGEKQWLDEYDKSELLKVSDECFEEMKALEVVSLRYADLSLKSLQFLPNLKTLELFGCNLRDICFLAKLNKLEILSFRGSCFYELPIELSELKELRMLDLRGCSELTRVPSNLIRSFSQLEELYMGKDIFEEREVEEKSIETGKARLSEVNDLPCLAILYLKIHSKCLPKDFAFSKLSRYQICVNESTFGYLESSKALKIADIDATLLTALFKALYHSVEYLSLQGVTGCQNILPSIDQKGLKKLNALKVRSCEDLKCMIDASQVGEENAELHPSLAELVLSSLPELQCIWKGPMSIIVNFQSLTDVYVRECKSLAYLFTLSIARSLRQLKSLRVEDCESLEFLIKIEEGDNGRGEKMLSKLENLRIERCKRLEYVFPVFVAAGLIQLKKLEIKDAAELKQVFHGKEEDEVAEEGKDIKLPNLKDLENNHSTLPALEEFCVIKCPNLTIKEGVLDEFQNLQVVKMRNCSNQLCYGILSGLRYAFFKIKELSMVDCGVLERELSLSNFKNLTSLKITHFNKLKHIFSPTVAPNHMLRLERLCIRECAELEQIIDVKDGEEVGANLLQTLSSIEVKKCHKLKNLFPISIARGFQQLAELKAIDNSELEQIFGDNDVIDEKEIQLPRLQSMWLDDLPRLTNFCHVDYHFIFPAPPLHWLEVEGCPKISTRFSWDEENKSVHAEAKASKIGSAEDESHQEQAPKIGSQEDSHQEQAPERGSEDETHEEQASEMGSEDDSHEEQASEMGSEDDSHEETSTALWCVDDFGNLPRYIKKKELYSDSHPTE